MEINKLHVKIALKGIGALFLLYSILNLYEGASLKQARGEYVIQKTPPAASPLMLATAAGLAWGCWDDLKGSKKQNAFDGLTIDVPVAEAPVQTSSQTLPEAAQTGDSPAHAESHLTPQGIDVRRKIETLFNNPDFVWIRDLIEAQAILVWGPQGSGKSTFVEFLTLLRVLYGYEMHIVDPHYAAGHWKGLHVVGAGLDYRAIGKFMREILREVREDYDQISKVPGYRPSKKSILLEEATNYSGEAGCKEVSGEFFRKALSDFRKATKIVIYVAHDNILKALGSDSGAKQRDNGMIQIEMIAGRGQNGKPAPSGWARLTIPGEEKVVQVKIPDLSKVAELLKRSGYGGFIHNPAPAPVLNSDDRNPFELPGETLLEPFPAEPQGKRDSGQALPEEDIQRIRGMVITLYRDGEKSATKIAETIAGLMFQVKKGGSSTYKAVFATVKETIDNLTKENANED